MAEHKTKIAVLASGGGSTAEALVHATQDGRIDAEVGLVVCSKPSAEAGVYSRMSRLNGKYGLDIEVAEISGRTHPSGNVGRGQTFSESSAICEKIDQDGFDHVALMGYMRIVRGELVETYGWSSVLRSIYEARMSNTHPGPLPETEDTYGLSTSELVLQLGLAASKHTLHLVSLGVDKGPKIAEHPVEILPDDTPQTLFDRVQVVEKTAYPYALGNFLRNQKEYQQK